MLRLSFFLCLVPLILFGAIGGFFYAYSVSVMQGLDNLSGTDAIRAMQELNRGTRNGVFLVSFLVTPILSVICAVILLVTGNRWAGLLLLGAAALYLAGSFVPTVTVSVPMNHEIEALSPDDLSAAEATRIWQEYSRDWTFWNTIRAVMGLAGLAFAGAAIHALDRGSHAAVPAR